jgi:hypothetical protein
VFLQVSNRVVFFVLTGIHQTERCILSRNGCFLIASNLLLCNGVGADASLPLWVGSSNLDVENQTLWLTQANYNPTPWLRFPIQE